MSQPKVQHRCAGVDAEVGPHDGAPEFVELLDGSFRIAGADQRKALTGNVGQEARSVVPVCSHVRDETGTTA